MKLAVHVKTRPQKGVGEEDFDEFFNGIVKMCIEKDLVKSRRYIVDTTDAAANVNYPSEKKLIRNAFTKVIYDLKDFNISEDLGSVNCPTGSRICYHMRI